jgi:hypothetical protein
MNGTIALALLMAAAGLAQELPVSADAHVSNLFPDVRFGALPFLEAAGNTRIFLKFDLGGVPPDISPSDVSRASLILWVNRVSKAGQIQVTDGPFAETKEQLGGFYLVDARDLDEAIAIAARIPTVRVGGAIEVRPVEQTPER